MKKLWFITLFLTAIFFVLGCGEKYTVLTDIPDAENAHFTSDGRLFVTGGKNAYEIKKGASGFYKTALYDGECNFCGITSRNGYLYSVCTKQVSLFSKQRYLLAARITSAPRFQVIHTFSGIELPNGIDFDSLGNLYVANTAVIGGKIVRLKFSSPTVVSSQATWLSSGVTTPNGLKINGSNMYITDIGAVKKIPIRADGSAGSVSTIYSRFSDLDDLMYYNGALVVADFVRGTIFYLTMSGSVDAETSGLMFSGPSSVTRGKGPNFSTNEVIVTEKGVIGNYSTLVGNRLSRFVPGN